LCKFALKRGKIKKLVRLIGAHGEEKRGNGRSNKHFRLEIVGLCSPCQKLVNERWLAWKLTYPCSLFFIFFNYFKTNATVFFNFFVFIG